MKFISITPVQGLFPPCRSLSRVTDGGDQQGRRASAHFKELRILTLQSHGANGLIGLCNFHSISFPAKTDAATLTRPLPTFDKTSAHLKKDLCQFEEKVGRGQPGIELGSKRIPGILLPAIRQIIPSHEQSIPPRTARLPRAAFQYAHLAPAHKLAAVDRLAEYRKEQEMAA